MTKRSGKECIFERVPEGTRVCVCRRKGCAGLPRDKGPIVRCIRPGCKNYLFSDDPARCHAKCKSPLVSNAARETEGE